MYPAKGYIVIGVGGTNQEHNVRGVRTDLEDDFWKALSKYKEAGYGGMVGFPRCFRAYF